MFPTLWWPNDENQQTSKILFSFLAVFNNQESFWMGREKSLKKKKQPTLVFHIWAGRNVPLSKCLPLYIFCCYFIFIFFVDFGSVEKKNGRETCRLFFVSDVFWPFWMWSSSRGEHSPGVPHTHTHTHTKLSYVKMFSIFLNDWTILEFQQFSQCQSFSTFGERERKEI
jgi:hypothetical protein